MPETIHPVGIPALGQHLDAAVDDVFQQMLGMICTPLEAAIGRSEQSITSSVQFSGNIDGECILYLSLTAGKATTEALLGETTDSCDSTVDDAIGELCNMIAGAWKNRLGAPLASSLLSVPRILRIPDSPNHNGCTNCFRRQYSFDGNVFGVVLYFRG